MSLSSKFFMAQPEFNGPKGSTPKEHSPDQHRSGSLRHRLNLSRLALSYPWLTLGFWLAVVTAGVFAFGSLKYALFPDIAFPVVVVNATIPATTAVETESRLTVPLEAHLGGLERLEGLKSTTYPGRSIITLSFGVGNSLEQATGLVEQQLKAKLPAGASYEVLPFNLNESAAISYAIAPRRSSETPAAETPTDKTVAPQSLASVAAIARERMIPALEAIPGVLKVELLGEGGGPSSAELDGAGLDGADPDGTTATLVRFNAQDALALQVVKRAEANTLDVVKQAERVIRRLQTQVPEVAIAVSANQATFIREATQATLEDLFGAVVLAIVIIFPFLWSWRATLIAALAIPISLLGTFIVMAIAGFNLETITLLALALVIGIVIDDAIVDVENIARHIESGESPKQAALNATGEIGLTVMAATLTIVAVFLPVGLMGGTVGQFFKPFGLTVSAAVLISLLVSRTLSPVLGALWLRPRDRGQRSPGQESGLWTHLLQGYRGILSWSLVHRWVVVGLALLSFGAGLALIPLVPQGFIPKLDRGEFNVAYTIQNQYLQTVLAQRFRTDARDRLRAAIPAEALGDYRVQPGDRWETIATNQAGTPAVAPLLAALNAADPSQAPAAGTTLQLPLDPRIVQTLAQTSPTAETAQPTPDQIRRYSLDASRAIALQLETKLRQNLNVESIFSVLGDRGAINQGRLYVRLKDTRAAHTSTIQDQIRQSLPAIADVSISVEDIQFVDTGGEKPLQVALQGDNLSQLLQTANAAADRLRRQNEFVDIEVTGEQFKTAEIETGDVPQIERKDSKRVAYITANLSESQALGPATAAVVTEVRSQLPAGVSVDLGGDSARSSTVLASFGTTLLLSIGCIFVVLVLLFGRLLDPVVVVLSLPLAVVGAMVGLVVTQSDFGMIAVIGFILLIGLVNKSAILLIDYVNQLRKQGVSRYEAILAAGPVRLRPILMTTLSTILGMTPIALGLGAGAELRQPLAVSAIGGLVTSTLLSLIVVPVLYSLLDDLQIGVSKRLGQRRSLRLRER